VLGVRVASGPPERPEVVGLAVVPGPDGPRLAVARPPAIPGWQPPDRLEPDWCARVGFTAKPGQTLALGPPGDGPLTVLVGTGPEGDDPAAADRCRQAGAGFMRAAGAGGTGLLVLPSGALPHLSAVAEGAVMDAGRFDRFRSRPRPGALDALEVWVEGDGAGGEALLARGARIGRAVVEARELINTPPSDLTPALLADRVAERLAPARGVTVEVWDEGRLEDERLGGVLAVARGSVNPPRLVRADYRPGGEEAPRVVLVGKGITFDSGGLSLKTPDGMTTMKTDMSGAAVVLGALEALAHLGVPVAVTALAPMAENMPGPGALKPGDVFTTRDGTTVEVLNTDAEGRLVLADALCLARELGPGAVVDVATLTGAARVALGTGIAPLFGSDDDLVARLRAAGDTAGEALWPMPLPEAYADHLDSDVADVKNIGRAGQAGAVAAALFLARFVGPAPWAHLDIAGTGRSTESRGYLAKGGNAFGLRTLVELVDGMARPAP
jgi:leucyl aminopeptidase